MGRKQLGTMACALLNALAEVCVLGRLGNDTTSIKALLDAFPLSVYVVDRDLTVVAWNAPRETGPQGIARENAMGRPLEGLLPPEGFRAAQRAILGVFETGLPSEETVATLRHHQIYRCRRLPVRQDGRVTHVLSTFEEVTEQERAQAALRASEAKYRLLFEGNPQPMWVYDVETLAFLDVNDAALKHYGYSRSEFLRMTIADIRAAEDLPRLRDAVRSLPPARRAARWRHRKKDRELIDVEISSHAMEFCGRPARLVLASDVTQRVRAEEALQTSERMLRDAQRLARIGSWEWDLNTGTLSWSDELYEIHGVDRDGNVPLLALFWQQVHPDDRARVEALGKTAIEEASPFDYHFRIIRPDGNVRTLQTRGQVLVDGDGRACKLVGADQDVTDLKATETALWQRTEQLQAITDAMLTFLTTRSLRQASEPLLQAALEHTCSAYGFIGVLADGPVLRIVAHEGAEWHTVSNRAFHEEAVRTDGQKGCLELRDLDNLFGRVVTSGRPIVSNQPSADPRPGELPAGHPPLRAFLGVPILGSRKEVVGMIGVANRPGGYSGDELGELEVLTHATGVLFDSHLRAEREASLEQQLRQAQRMEAMGTLAGGVAHDFNNLIGVITGYADLLLKGLPVDGPQTRRLSEIRRAGERAAGLTRQLLAFSRKQVVQQRPVSLNALSADVEKMLRRLIGEHIELITAFDPQLGLVTGDPGQLEQVLMNLAVNARDAMPSGGTLRIETANASLAPPDPAESGGNRGGRYVCLKVSDTGCGMDRDTQRRIFEPFFTTKELGKGTGLGLATVYGIVEQAGGHIKVESEPGCGSSFHVFLPRLDDGVLETREPERVKAIQRGPTATILLVEDDALLRAALADLLTGDGHTVVQASDPEEALTRVPRERSGIGLILTDVVMPKMNGRRLVERLEEQGVRVPVVYMSGYTDGDLPLDERTRAEGRFLQKPFPSQALLQSVREALASG